MKFLPILLAVLLSPQSLFSQLLNSKLNPGFNPQEAKDMIQLCNSFTYLDLYGSDNEIIPEGYVKRYTSPIIGMDNRFQIYTKGSVGVINYRGSTDKKVSWMENINSAIIPAKGTIEIKGHRFNYKFANDTAAGVHSGYALGLAYLHLEVEAQVRKLNAEGIFNIIITGHSQGGSLAILTRAHFNHLPNRDISKKNVFKVYAFAQPMVGNIEFIKEYNRNYCDREMSYSLINPSDMVPMMPLSFNDSTYWQSNLMKALSKDEEFDKSKMLKEGLTILFQNKLQGTVEKFGKSVKKQIEKDLGEVTLPEPRKEINYSQVGNVIQLPPPDYPLELKDSSILSDDYFLADHPRDENGVFENKSVYKKTSVSQNHKPYNYYTSVLKVYFPDKYDAVEPKLFGLN